MSYKWLAKKNINEFIELLAVSPVKQFYPTAVPKYYPDISLDLAYEELLKICKTGEIQLLWEIKCSGEEGQCFRSLDKVRDPNLVLDKDYCCDICGSENTISSSDIYPIFEIDFDYQVYMRDEFEKKSNQTARMRLEVK